MATALPKPKTLTITIDQTVDNPLKIVYTIDGATAVEKQLTGIKTNDDTIVNEIFSNFLKDSELLLKYTETVSNLKPLIKDTVLLYRNFDDFQKALGDMTPDEIKEFNKKAIIVALEYINKRILPATTSNVYFTPDAIALAKGKTTGYFEGEKFGPYSKTVSAQIMAYVDDSVNEAELKKSTFLSKFLNVNKWVTQLTEWLKQFKNNASSNLTPATALNVDIGKGGNSNKTQKNRNVYDE
jgi:hypothetical protein